MIITCEICNGSSRRVDNVECPECGMCPLLCAKCAAEAPCPKCGYIPPKPKAEKVQPFNAPRITSRSLRTYYEKK